MKNKVLFVLVLAAGSLPSLALAANPFSTPLAGRNLLLKVGRPENLIDNPARVVKIRQYVCDHFFELQQQDSEPKDPIYLKKSQNESMAYSGQVIAPLADILSLQAGYAYGQWLLGNQSISTSDDLDDTVFRDEDRTFSRKFNAGVSVQALPDLAAGYAFGQETEDGRINLATDDASWNSTRLTTHTVGFNYSAWDVFLAYATEDYQGEYNGRREADFANTLLQANLRYLWGEAGRENLCATAGYTYGNLQQKTFEFGRPTFALDFLNYQLQVSGYYDVPAGGLEYAFGLEGAYADKSLFAYDQYDWANYQTYRIALPCLLSVQALPWLKLWAEAGLSYDENTHTRTRAWSLQETFGLQARYAFCEALLYAMPAGLWSNSDTEDNSSAARVGLEVKAVF